MATASRPFGSAAHAAGVTDRLRQNKIGTGEHATEVCMHVGARLGRAASQEVVGHEVCCVTKNAQSRVAQQYSRGKYVRGVCRCIT